MAPRFLEYLTPTQFIQSRNPRIIDQARKIVSGTKSPLEIIRKVVEWTRDNLDKRPTMSVPSALDVLDSGVGDCNEHAVLATALLRASGVPARLVVGIMYHNRRFYYHAWVEAFLRPMAGRGSLARTNSGGRHPRPVSDRRPGPTNEFGADHRAGSRSPSWMLNNALIKKSSGTAS